MLLTREPVEALGERGIEPQLMHAFAGARHGWAVTGRGQARRFVQLSQLPAPESLRSVLVLALQPGQEVAIAPRCARQRLPGVILQHFAEHPRVAPAVHQNVVAGEDQPMTIICRAQQAQAQQRRVLQVEAARTISQCTGFEHGRQIRLIAHIDFRHFQAQLTMDHLQWRIEAVAAPDETGAQHFVAIHHALPGLLETRDVEAVDVEQHLVDVGTGVSLVQAVEQNALLHRRQRVNVLDLLRGDRQAVQLRLGQAGQRHIGRRQTSAGRAQAMVDQLAQRPLISPRQRMDGCVFEDVAAVGPGQAQLPLVDTPVNGQPVAHRRLLVLPRAFVFAGRHPQGAVIEVVVELAEVIERYLRLRQLAEGRLRLGAAQVTQQAETDAFVGDRAQLLLDALDRRFDAGLRSEAHREQAGEPAHGAAQVEVVEQVFATMPFELHQGAVGSGPFTEYAGQRG